MGRIAHEGKKFWRAYYPQSHIGEAGVYILNPFGILTMRVRVTVYWDDTIEIVGYSDV